MTIVSYSTVPDNNQALAPENTMPVNAINDAIRTDAANVRAFANELPWYNYGSGNGPLTTERISNTQFRVAADLRAIYQVGRKVRATGTSTGDIRGRITASSFASPYTTVTVLWDSGLLAAEAITIYISTMRSGAMGTMDGNPLIFDSSGNTRMVAATDSLGSGADIFAGGARVASIRPERFNLFGINDDEFVNPRLQLIRRKPTAQAAFDSLGSVDFYGRDSSEGSSDVLYSRMWSRPVTVTPGATDGLIDWAVNVAGTLTRMMRLRPSVLLIGKTFADSGATPGVELHADGDVFARAVSATHTAPPVAANLTGYTTGTVKLATFAVDGAERAAVTWDGTNAALTGQAAVPPPPTAAYAVGTYVFAARLNPTFHVDYGDTIAGNQLVPAGMVSNTLYLGNQEGSRNGVGLAATALSGTWRCMGFSRHTNDINDLTQSATLWLRIS